MARKKFKLLKGIDAMEEKNIRIRRAQIADVEMIWFIEKSSFSKPWSKEAFINEFTTNKFAYYYCLDIGDKMVGYAGMWIILDEAHITNVAIHPDYRGNKLGKLLMSYLIAAAKRLGADSMTLEVRVSNTIAQNLYRKLNFQEQGIRKNYYADTMEDALIMWVKI